MRVLQENWDLLYVYVRNFGFIGFQNSVPEGKFSFIHIVYFVAFRSVSCFVVSVSKKSIRKPIFWYKDDRRRVNSSFVQRSCLYEAVLCDLQNVNIDCVQSYHISI